MSSIAILIGNADYLQQTPLDCCRRDVEAMQRLLEATERFERVDAHIDLRAEEMRDVVRNALPADGGCDEIFFYFSGHGDQQGADFYYCGTDYDTKQPNLTGLSSSVLHDLCRAASPTTLVTVTDACYSGTLLIKKGPPPSPPIVKDGFRNVLHFSSSMDSQTSMGGNPLSEFTLAFLEASARKTEGPVYYTDIEGALRDAFLHNDDQTPFFVSQATGRELLVDDAARLAGFRAWLSTTFRAPDADGTSEEDVVTPEPNGTDLIVPPPPTPRQILEAAESKTGSADRMRELTRALFDGVDSSFDANEFAEFFEKSLVYHNRYEEAAVEDFMIRVLAREDRPDSLVTAEIKRVRRKRTPWERMTGSLAFAMSNFEDDFTERFDLSLNCQLDQAQLKITLTPKFSRLQQIVLILSCAPSLEYLYVFEIVSLHFRNDWDRFDTEGREILRRWYKLTWSDSADGLIEKIQNGLAEAARKHVDDVIQTLGDD
ncbi:caspase family protein [Sphingomonas crocodyli]|uniref:Caspase family protein n=1 Tax=Sphingomonas crocodyli TaxID=1979270 RepID=A0A437M6W0_9SPHN|nr:caspase family protein [Sphingomonas crocodyli]RVT93451.1 caspase family protein [Sphingomonas crocodyli]